MNTELISKIQKLLSLAGSSNEHEAKLATERANELLIKHNLSLQQVKNSNLEYTEAGFDVGYSLKHQHRSISAICSDFFFVKTILHSEVVNDTGSRRVKKKTIQLLGTPENVKVASYIFEYLNKTFPALWKQFLKENPQMKGKKNSYFSGLELGIAKNLEKTKWKVQEEMGLVLVSDPKLDEFANGITKGKSYHQNKCTIDKAVAQAGYNDGLEIVINKPIEHKSSDVKFIEKIS